MDDDDTSDRIIKRGLERLKNVTVYPKKTNYALRIRRHEALQKVMDEYARDNQARKLILNELYS